MTDAKRIAEELVSLLKEASPDATRLSKLATDYAVACRDINSRLTQIGEVLDAGDDRQALLIAESPPPVMDDADALYFPQLDRWKALCEAEGLQLAPAIKASVVHRLNSLYAKGVSGDHRIYKDFRSAVLSRNDEEALVLARAIEKLSPNDANAAKERVRLEEKVFRARVAKLEKAIAAGDGDAVEQTLTSVREFGAKRDAGEPPAVAKANELLRGQRARASMVRCKEWTAQLGKLVPDGEWQAVGDILARADEAVREHGLVFAPEMQATLQDGRSFFTGERAKFLQTAAFQAALRDLQAQAETVESHTQMPGVKPVSQLSEYLTSLNRCWQKVNSYGREVDESIIQRVSKQVDGLRTEIARRQKKRLLTAIAGVALGIALVSVIGWYLLGMYRANEVASEISSGIAANQLSVVEQLIGSANSNGLAKFSAGLQGRLEEGQTWLDNRKSESDAALDQLMEFESSAAENFKNRDASATHARFEELMTAINEMPKEKQADLLPRAVKIRDSLAQWSRGISLDIADVIQRGVDEFETGVGLALRQKQTLQSFEKLLGDAEKIILSWDEHLASGTIGLSLPPGLQAAVDGTRDTLADLRKNVNDLNENLATIRTAKTLPEFTERMVRTSESPLIQIDEVQALRPVARQKFDSDAIMANLMFPWNPLAWRAFLKGEEASRLHPEETLKLEDGFFGRVFNDQFTKSIYRADISGRPNRTIYTKGTALLADDRDQFDVSTSETRRIKTFTGSMFDPAFDGSVVRFEMRTLTSAQDARNRATEASNIGPSAPSVIYGRMQLEGFYKDGKPGLSLWEILDRATSAAETSPLYLGFVAQNIALINSARPFAWGAHFAPSGAKLLQQVGAATGGASIRSGSWFVHGSDEEMENQLKPLFSAPSCFLKEALLNRALARAAKAAGASLLYAGYVGPDGLPVLAPSVPLTDALWGLSGSPPDQQASLLYKLAPKGDNSSVYESVTTAQLFVPLFYFPGDRKQIFATAEGEVSITPALLGRLQIPTLFRDIATKEGGTP